MDAKKCARNDADLPRVLKAKLFAQLQRINILQ